jgi:hypothetical protein
MNVPLTPTSLREPRSGALASVEPDHAVDLFSARGFALAQRIATAFAESSAVPATFRRWNEKKGPQGSTWVENTAALGNCIVAVETARSVGMSITAVMQQANIIEGKLSWSAQFVIAAINASGRFTPLRFHTRNLGRLKASYREKLGWNKAKSGYDFRDVEVAIENIECIAWALPKGFALPAGVFTLEQVRAQGLPVVESAPVSLKMAVEEGWYGKSGSKWQTEMRSLMLQYRAGAFFGRIHAPDVVMGMGRTTEEVQDMTTVDVASDGTVTAVTLETVSRTEASPQAEVIVAQVNGVGEATETESADDPAVNAARRCDGESDVPGVVPLASEARIPACSDVDALDLLADELRSQPESAVRATLQEAYQRRRAELVEAATRTENRRPRGNASME